LEQKNKQVSVLDATVKSASKEVKKVRTLILALLFKEAVTVNSHCCPVYTAAQFTQYMKFMFFTADL